MTGPAKLEVSVSGVRVGHLDRNREGAIRFSPDAAWLDGGQRPRLGYSFLVDPGPRVEGGRLPAWFENLLPSRSSPLRARICREAGIREGQSLALLTYLGRDLPGAVEVRGLADAVEDGPDEARLRPRLRASIPGMQLKLSMVRSGKRFSLPMRDDAGSWIVKLPGKGNGILPRVEAATMTWASRVGIRVPAHQVVPLAALDGVPPEWEVEGAEVYAVERFDRGPNRARHHQEDLCQALGWPPTDLYANGANPRRQTSYDMLGRLVADAAGLEAAEAYVRRVAFLVAAGDTDGHLKNHSLAWGESGRATLAPVYDQVSCISLPGMGWAVSRPDLALRFGGRSSLVDLDGERVDRFARKCGIPRAREIFLDTLEACAAALGDLDLPPAMADALAEHWRAVPILRSFTRPAG